VTLECIADAAAHFQHSEQLQRGWPFHGLSGLVSFAREDVRQMDEARFRQAMGHFATGVAVVTARHEGEISGMTVNAFASVSLEPMLLLICIEKRVRTHDLIASSGRFGVSILRSDQEEISRRFASPSENKFSGVGLRDGETATPLLDPCLATVECRVYDTLPGGDHTIYLGEVTAMQVFDGDPLIYFRGGYHQLR